MLQTSKNKGYGDKIILVNIMDLINLFRSLSRRKFAANHLQIRIDSDFFSSKRRTLLLAQHRTDCYSFC